MHGLVRARFVYFCSNSRYICLLRPTLNLLPAAKTSRTSGCTDRRHKGTPKIWHVWGPIVVLMLGREPAGLVRFKRSQTDSLLTLPMSRKTRRTKEPRPYNKDSSNITRRILRRRFLSYRTQAAHRDYNTIAPKQLIWERGRALNSCQGSPMQTMF
jgi:hypothetical protein